MPALLTLEQALLRYDRLQSTKRHYNVHALNIYLKRAEDIQADAAQGKNLRTAIMDGFSDRLRDFVLKAMGLAPMTDAERARRP